MEQLALDLYKEVITAAIPIAIVFELGNLITSTFLRAAFGGRLWFGR